ncbi:glycosyltransferase [Agrococcus carbonis]|uniref:Dolichol-phosphate mannosyltransferase n=1 Tax=Agrococcus carbonis TaxID=684552 RepID=A0A1H1KU19_9MICO|nr:glycosyltransferase [Agrococcus carbonis]SDR65851.1 dolichol-phosphate mannosyltransferase [Agrococcus carbonis]
MPDVMIVVPTYDEIEGLERTVGRLRQSVPHAELVIIDDGSPDGTGELADRLAKADAGTLVIHRTERGYRSAVIEGMRFAMSRGATRVVVTDADGSYDADGLPELLAVSQSGVDLVIGSRFVEGSDVRNMGPRRRWAAQIGNAYARAMLSTGVKDLTSSLRVYRTRILERIDLDAIEVDAYAFQIAMAVRVAQAGGTIAEVPIGFIERAVGSSKMRVFEELATLGAVTKWGLSGVRALPKPPR